jgi:hypothetical protein
MVQEMRKTCKRTKRRLVVPTIIALHLNPEVSLQERMAVEALRGGWSTTDHFNVLADCRDMLVLAANEKGDKTAIAACDLAGVALMNMKDRYTEKKRIGATGDELQALDLLVTTSEDFWKRQSGGLFIDADEALGRARKMRASEASMREAI